MHQGRPALDGLAATASVAVRALPPLLAVLLFLSPASETWRAFGRLEGWRYGFVLLLFGILGILIVDRALTEEWIGEAPNVLVAVSIEGREVVLTEALVRVSAILGGFASLYSSRSRSGTPATARSSSTTSSSGCAA